MRRPTHKHSCAMDELMQLRTYIETEQYDDALLMITEMEAMAKDDKLDKLDSFALVLLVHLIKQQAEKRTTRSWSTSIALATREIVRTNKRRKAGGYYADNDELREILNDVFSSALQRAALEAFEGMHSDEELERMLDKQALLDEAFALIRHE
jgi:Domain of unknown function DUF29